MIVRSVQMEKGKVKIEFDNNSKIVLSKENYIENPLAINSVINEKRIFELLENEKSIEFKNKLLKLLTIKVLSEFEAKEYLHDNGLSETKATLIINKLKEIHYLNDLDTAYYVTNSLLSKKKGIKVILENLYKKGIKTSIIEEAISSIDQKVYLANFQKVCEKYSKMYSSKGKKMKEQMIFIKLKEYGYEEELIKKITVLSPQDNEVANARRYLVKFMKSKDSSLERKEMVNKIKLKLAQRGFDYDIINKVLKEVYGSEID